MLNLVKIAVTGGLSSGKSSACCFFKELGAYVMSADEIVHQLLSSHTIIEQKVIELIGSDIVVDQQIDRSKIASKVFNQPQLLKSLEDLLHPAVYEEIEKQYEKIRQQEKFPLFVAEIPLLFESHGEGHFDYTVAILTEDEVCKDRFCQAGGDVDSYRRRAARQLSGSEKARKADFTIRNTGSLKEMKNAVKDLFNHLTKN